MGARERVGNRRMERNLGQHKAGNCSLMVLIVGAHLVQAYIDKYLGGNVGSYLL